MRRPDRSVGFPRFPFPATQMCADRTSAGRMALSPELPPSVREVYRWERGGSGRAAIDRRGFFQFAAAGAGLAAGGVSGPVMSGPVAAAHRSETMADVVSRALAHVRCLLEHLRHHSRNADRLGCDPCFRHRRRRHQFDHRGFTQAPGPHPLHRRTPRRGGGLHGLRLRQAYRAAGGSLWARPGRVRFI